MLGANEAYTVAFPKRVVLVDTLKQPFLEIRIIRTQPTAFYPALFFGR